MATWVKVTDINSYQDLYVNMDVIKCVRNNVDGGCTLYFVDNGDEYESVIPIKERAEELIHYPLIPTKRLNE